MRNFKRTAIVISLILFAVGAVKTVYWYSIGDEPRIDSYSIRGDILPYSVARRVAGQYTSEKDYFYKYLIEETYTRSESFPTINVKIDTVKTEIWERKSRR